MHPKPDVEIRGYHVSEIAPCLRNKSFRGSDSQLRINRAEEMILSTRFSPHFRLFASVLTRREQPHSVDSRWYGEGEGLARERCVAGSPKEAAKDRGLAAGPPPYFCEVCMYVSGVLDAKMPVVRILSRPSYCLYVGHAYVWR